MAGARIRIEGDGLIGGHCAGCLFAAGEHGGFLLKQFQSRPARAQWNAFLTGDAANVTSQPGGLLAAGVRIHGLPPVRLTAIGSLTDPVQHFVPVGAICPAGVFGNGFTPLIHIASTAVQKRTMAAVGSIKSCSNVRLVHHAAAGSAPRVTASRAC